MPTPQHTGTRRTRATKHPINDAKVVSETKTDDRPWTKNEQLDAWEHFNVARDQLLKDMGISSWRRATVAFVSSLAAAGAVGYGVAAVTEVAMISAMVFTGSAFIAFVVWLIGCCIAVYAGLKISGRVARYILDEEIDRDIARVASTVRAFTSYVKGLVHA
jgi:hypothetical protein